MCLYLKEELQIFPELPFQGLLYNRWQTYRFESEADIDYWSENRRLNFHLKCLDV